MNVKASATIKHKLWYLYGLSIQNYKNNQPSFSFKPPYLEPWFSNLCAFRPFVFIIPFVLLSASPNQRSISVGEPEDLEGRSLHHDHRKGRASRTVLRPREQRHGNGVSHLLAAQQLKLPTHGKENANFSKPR